MFGRKRKVIGTWDELEDSLVGNFDAEPGSHDELRMIVKWKGVGSQEIRVSRAMVPDLGMVIYICAPIADGAGPAECRRAMASAADFLLGGIAIEGSWLVLRSSIPYVAMPFPDIKWLIEQTALGARSVREDLEGAPQ
ncbi:MAG: hypothetical protein Q3979_03415 [Actinomycetaceae bacterium]|nr:hypothetical protein [Actinomycetaceae bacterium]